MIRSNLDVSEFVNFLMLEDETWHISCREGYKCTPLHWGALRIKKGQLANDPFMWVDG
jgi:hypothetical protein